MASGQVGNATQASASRCTGERALVQIKPVLLHQRLDRLRAAQARTREISRFWLGVIRKSPRWMLRDGPQAAQPRRAVDIGNAPEGIRSSR